MTRGNQRDKDRERAQARNAGSKANSTLKTAGTTADIMREKQRLAEEKKAQAQANPQQNVNIKQPGNSGKK